MKDNLNKTLLSVKLKKLFEYVCMLKMLYHQIYHQSTRRSILGSDGMMTNGLTAD